MNRSAVMWSPPCALFLTIDWSVLDTCWSVSSILSLKWRSNKAVRGVRNKSSRSIPVSLASYSLIPVSVPNRYLARMILDYAPTNLRIYSVLLFCGSYKSRCLKSLTWMVLPDSSCPFITPSSGLESTGRIRALNIPRRAWNKSESSGTGLLAASRFS